MKLIINTSNLHGGGGTQVGFSFIHECIKFPENEYSVFLCPQLSNEIDLKKFPSNFDFYNFPSLLLDSIMPPLDIQLSLHTSF